MALPDTTSGLPGSTGKGNEMLEWLESVTQDVTAIPASLLVARLLMAFGFGILIAGACLIATRRDRSEAAPFLTTLVLMTILIAMVTMVIGNSVARAFSLVGALAIVRFRTVVDDTRDTAFVIFAVVVGMAVGTGTLLIPLIGIPVVAIAAISLGCWGPCTAHRDGNLELRIAPEQFQESRVRALLEPLCEQLRLKDLRTARQNGTVELTWRIRLREGMTAFTVLAELQGKEGILSVEFRHT